MNATMFFYFENILYAQWPKNKAYSNDGCLIKHAAADIAS